MMVAAAPTVPAPGVVVGGNYRLENELGRGGMGQVFLARDTRLARMVALKFLDSDGDELTMRRFLIEARATAQCTHENIVVIHDVGTWQGRPYMVLEYLEGAPLTSSIVDRPLNTYRVLEIAIAVTRALVRAHEAGIVHRDLKPDNIFITTAGTVKVLDFGIVKLGGSHSLLRQTSGRDDYHTLSGPGRLVGTMPYMAPEQWRLGDSDARSDVFALGVIMFRLLTLTHPAGSSDPEVLEQAALATEPYPSLGVLGPAFPAALVELVDKCLAKEPEHRFANARDLLAALERCRVVREDSGIEPAHPVAAPARSRWRFATLAAVAVAALASGYGISRSISSPVAPAPATSTRVASPLDAPAARPPPIAEQEPAEAVPAPIPAPSPSTAKPAAPHQPTRFKPKPKQRSQPPKPKSIDPNAMFPPS